MSEIDYLSSEWIRLADEAVAGLSPVDGHLTVGVRVTAGEGRADRGYRLILGPDEVRVVDDDDPGAVRLTMSYGKAVAIAQGELGAQQAFLDGDIRLGGDTTALLGHQQKLAEIDDRLADLRARTRF